MMVTNDKDDVYFIKHKKKTLRNTPNGPAEKAWVQAEFKKKNQPVTRNTCQGKAE